MWGLVGWGLWMMRWWGGGESCLAPRSLLAWGRLSRLREFRLEKAGSQFLATLLGSV